MMGGNGDVDHVAGQFIKGLIQAQDLFPEQPTTYPAITFKETPRP
jgi:hypothetical protein